MSKMGKRVRKQVEDGVDRLCARVDAAAPVTWTFWGAPELDTCFDILVLTYRAGNLLIVAPADRNSI